MNILYTNFHAGAGIGGHTVYVLNLVRALSRLHQVAVATPDTSALYRLAADIPGVSVYAQAYPNRLTQLAPAVNGMRRLLRAGRYDVVHVNGSADHRLVMLASLGMRRPAIVFTKHNDQPATSFGAAVRARLATDRVIAVCDYVARRMAATPYRRCGVVTVGNGIDTGYFQPAQPAEVARQRARWLGPDHAGKVFLGSNAGTDDYKAWIDMLRAVALLPAAQRARVHVAIAGDPPAPELLAQVEALGLGGQFTYAGRYDDVRPLVAAFDAGFVLSHRVETISFACREMMAMGKPVMVTRHAGLPENITPDKDGWIVPPRDPAAIALVLGAILDGKYDLRRMGESARAKSERQFGLAAFVAATEAVYLGLRPA